MRLSIELIVTILLTIGGTLFSTIAYREWRSTAQIIKQGKQTKGVVTDLAKRPRRTGEQFQTTSLAPVVLFYSEKGQHVYYSQTYTTPVPFSVGEAVDIWYLPDDPQRATLKGADGWILPVVFGAFGGVMCLIGYSLLLKLLVSYLKIKLQSA